MNKNLIDIISEYNVSFFENGDYFDIWRNGKTMKIYKNTDNLMMVILDLEDFCIQSPLSNKKAKVIYSEFFRTPKKGEFILVKKTSDGCVDKYSKKKFKEFKNNKIVCENENGDEFFYDFYQLIINEFYPKKNLWFNSFENRVFWSVIEKIFSIENKGRNIHHIY